MLVPYWILLGNHRGPKKAHWTSKQILTRRKASEHPRGANCWSQLLPIGLTRLESSNHTLWPLLGLQGHQKGLFWPKRSLYGAPEGLRGPLRARFDPNCRHLVRLRWNHGYHKFWAGIVPPFGPRGAQRRPVLAQNDPFWPCSLFQFITPHVP